MGLHGVCRALPPRDVMGILSNAEGRKGMGLAPTGLTPVARLSRGGLCLPPTCLLLRKLA